MEQSDISFNLVGSSIGEDIYSDQGILLLKKGTILKEVHIVLLQKFRFGTKVSIETNDVEPTSYDYNLSSSLSYRSFQTYLKEVFPRFLSHRYINLAELREKYFEMIELSLYDISIMKVLQTKVSKEDYLYQHSINVGIFSAIIGKLVGLEHKECLLLAEMGLWHDIGMFNIDKEIVFKEGPLLNEEFQKVQRHTKMGYNLLQFIPDIHPMIRKSALLHHERINGSGYPNRLKTEDIPYGVQIVSVADCFNAMGMNTNYGTNKSNFEAIYELVKASQNNHLNPAIVIPFVRYVMRQNLFQSVKLSNGKTAEIIFIHDHEPHQPLVKMNNEYIDLRKESSLRIVGFTISKSVEEDVKAVL